MRGTSLLFVMVAIAGVLGTAGLMSRAYADRKDSVALTGQVTSAEEGAMEGVLVSAKKAGSSITTTVFTDERAGTSFPRRDSKRVTTLSASELRDTISKDRMPSISPQTIR